MTRRVIGCAHESPACAECRAIRRRRYSRQYAQRRRDRQLERELQTAKRCPRRAGPYPCGGKLTVDVEVITGRTLVRCDWCERRRRGLCCDCSSSVEGRIGSAIRCRLHKKAANRRSERAHVARNREEIRAKARERDLADPEKRARHNEYKRLWRKLNPDKVKAQKRREALSQPKRVYEYMRRYRAKYREYYREIALRRYYELHPTRPPAACITCGEKVIWQPGWGRPALRCDECVYPCERRRRERVRAARAARPPALAEKKPQKVRRPKGRRVTDPGERPCVSCSTIVHGRRKKCDPCTARDRELAAAEGKVGVGRGARLDLSRRAA